MMSGQVAAALLDDIFTTGDDSEESYARFQKICADKFNDQYDFYAKFRNLVHEDIENANRMNKYAKEIFPDSKPVYSVVMYRFITEVLGKTISAPPPADKRLSQ